ncbi:MAG TPA: NAD-dependent epimerase/dehydratase family protein [Bryobacteraceae bacterium]|nr:NAD-dependent epimerase/dehydratase family protein [Bryobacteraceae bacterium]
MLHLGEERFFITGATGFVGSCLARKLTELGCEVHVLARPGANRWRLDGLENKLHFHKGDLTDLERLRQFIRAVEPTIIYHLAVHGAYPHETDADQIILTDVFGTWNLLKACAEVDYKLLINTGSSSEYGAKPYAMRETDPLEPGSYYAVAKCAQTLVCGYRAHAEHRPINTLRLFSVYGPYEEPSRFVPTVIQRCLAGHDLDTVPPETARDFIYVDDVVDALLRVDELSLQYGEVFNIGSGVQSTVREVVEQAIKLTGSSVKVNWGAMPGRAWDTDTWLADYSKARRALRWAPRTSLASGLEKTIQWFRSRGYWKPQPYASHAVRDL